jgi:hypothetical protein
MARGSINNHFVGVIREQEQVCAKFQELFIFVVFVLCTGIHFVLLIKNTKLRD